jgi:glutathione S-transferase
MAPFFLITSFWISSRLHEARHQAENETTRPAPRRADRALLLADAERLEDLDHAGGVRVALRCAPRRHFQGRAVHSKLSENLAEQPHPRHRRPVRPGRRDFLAGRYSIADIACVGWVRLAERQGQDLAQFPNLERWFETIRARPAVKRAFAIRVEAASKVDVNDAKVRAVLFGQRARSSAG